MFEEIGSFQFDSVQRDKFKSGELPKFWAKQYPQIFDELDLELAINQPNYHFLEWLAAILLFNSTGYFSLLEQYEFKRHERKQKLFKEIVTLDVLDVINSTSIQCPDLFVYSPDRSDWYFCEVKGPGDRLRPVQKDYFEKLSVASGKAIRIVKLKKQKDNKLFQRTAKNCAR